MPRRYRMAARSAAVQETRRRIVEAAMALHTQQGILPTSYQEIAQRAGTALATVYRHFPTLDDLVRACAGGILVLRPLTPEQAAATFRGLTRLAARLEVLVYGTFDCYERDRGWLHAARREEDLVPALRDAARVLRDNLRTLTAAALEGHQPPERTITLIASLIDFPVWETLRTAGLNQAETAEEILELVRGHLARVGIL